MDSSMLFTDSVIYQGMLATGKWKKDEIDVANAFIKAFLEGNLPDEVDGTNLETFLASKMNCLITRIAFKFSSKSMMQRVYKTRTTNYSEFKNWVEVNFDDFGNADELSTEFTGLIGEEALRLFYSLRGIGWDEDRIFVALFKRDETFIKKIKKIYWNEEDIRTEFDDSSDGFDWDCFAIFAEQIDISGCVNTDASSDTSSECESKRRRVSFEWGKKEHLNHQLTPI